MTVCACAAVASKQKAVAAKRFLRTGMMFSHADCVCRRVTITLDRLDIHQSRSENQ